MKQFQAVLKASFLTLLISQAGCSSEDEKAATTTPPAKSQQTAQKDFPKASQVPSNRGTVTNVDKVPEGLANDPNKPNYADPAPKKEVKSAPRPNTAPPAPKNQNNGGASSASNAANSPAAASASSGTGAAQGAAPRPAAAVLRGDYSGRGPFPGETGYLYGAYPRVQPQSTAQAQYVSPYSGQGRIAPPVQGGAIYFANNSAQLSPQDIAQLQQIANAALAYGKIVQISGHASADRSLPAREHNAQLSAARAQAVAAQLQAWGVPPTLIQVNAYGDGIAVARGGQTGAFDRRVDIFFVN